MIPGGRVGRGLFPLARALVLAACLLAAAPGAAEVPARGDQAPLVLGVLGFYEVTARNQNTYDLLLETLHSRGLNVYPRAVQGSYADLVDWISKGKIDLASMPAATFHLARTREPRLAPLCTVLRRGAKGVPVDHTTSMVVARKGQLPGDWSALQRLRVCFTTPLSTSGYLYPLSSLASHGVTIAEPHRFAGGHDKALALLCAPPGLDGVDVAVVSSLAFDALPEWARARLDARPLVDARGQIEKVPNDVIVAKASLPASVRERVRTELCRYDGRTLSLPVAERDPVLGVVGFKSWDERSGPGPREAAACKYLRFERYSIEDALDAIEVDTEFKRKLASFYARPWTPRLALVLSGGGAAGAFQAGAALEVWRALGRRNLKADIIVGTSVGAINGSALATGRAEALGRFWSTVSLPDVVNVPEREYPVGGWKFLLLWMAQRAPGLLTVILVVLAAYLQFLAFAALFRPLAPGPGTVLVVAIGLELVLWLTNCYQSAVLHVSVLSLLAAGVARPVIDRILSCRWGRRLLIVQTGLVILALCVVPTEIVRALSSQDGLFSHRTLYGTLGRMILDMRGVSSAGLSLMDVARRVEEESLKLSREKLPSTLVISTTDFDQMCGRYFYLGSDQQVADRARELGYVSIATACPDKFLDLLLASSSVFPVLRPRQVLLRDGRLLRLVDGAFVHSNPVRVAVDLGATHVLIIAPSSEGHDEGLARPAVPAPVTPGAGTPGGMSLVTAFLDFLSSLIPRNQLEDLKAGEEVTSFLLCPDPGRPCIGLLEFDGHFASDSLPWSRPVVSLAEAFEQGREAAGSRRSGFRQWSRGAFQLPPVH